MRIAHVSDFHFTHLTWNPLRLLSKRFLGNLNWILNRKKHFFEHQLGPLPELFEELGVDLLLLGGDFSTTALPKEFKKATSFIGLFKQPWIATPGNHDRYTRRSCRSGRFYRYFPSSKKEVQDPVDFFTQKDHRIEVHKIAPINRGGKKGSICASEAQPDQSEAIRVSGGNSNTIAPRGRIDMAKPQQADCSLFTAPVNNNWRVITLDTAQAAHWGSSEGRFSEKLEEYLKEVLTLIPKEESIILLSHYPFFQNDVPKHNLIRGEALQKILHDNPQIRLYLHGHTHRHTIADLQVSNLPIVLDSGSCAQGRKGAWNLIDLQDNGCTISTYRWDHKWTKTRTEEFTWKR